MTVEGQMLRPCRIHLLALLMMCVLVPAAWGQPQTQEQAAPIMETESSKMEHMADAMKMEMQMMSRWSGPALAACITFGVLIAIALVLFIVLEIQWIRLLNRRIKSP
jgi:septal ring-binding cell division protein DamX